MRNATNPLDVVKLSKTTLNMELQLHLRTVSIKLHQTH